MRAVWLKEFGGPEMLLAGEAPDPEPGPGQVLIDVAYANITFVETQLRAGGPGPFSPQLPVIPGNGVGGVVIGGADGDLLGERVVTSLSGSGGYAERVVVPASAPFVVPAGLALSHAVALLADGRTAMALIHAAGIQPGERVLVEAAAGGVGTLLVQLARAAGATVLGAAGGARKTEVVRDLGAVPVDYSVPGWSSTVDPVDVVFDGVGGEIGRAAFALTRQGGRFFSYGLVSGAWTPVDEDRGVQVHRGPLGTPEELRERTAEILRLAAAGEVEPVVGQRFRLEEAAEAHRAIESRRTIGKTLLIV
ncbi:zinc-binding dehydrogenase [Amycolatopsis sp.]|uniref:zinc-binding dehydrogenase n=1 Tax=Amycolatopsis sp. TaxID=37632 RepID=UPI002C7C7545|nr:zinc-binding dehydrogenase [Amycolatopsis sp.]HVV13122.1 zinc-binding dehydrogenase [Amycolatopsis sp.]